MQFRSTPHARGSTLEAEREAARERVYPACAGIHRSVMASLDSSKGLPRMRGDPPSSSFPTPLARRSTPHARGSTSDLVTGRMFSYVYPACAGIHPDPCRNGHRWLCLPRMRGDPPVQSLKRGPSSASTPHARGSTVEIKCTRCKKIVYPACAGIHLHEKS